ncbi:glycosyltransferase family 4 protein [Dactylosporangium sp. NPDC005555]|uniref:glycosyltransferase family 4 protein n=1 Tax=Dactylosporangium sp. NPDC005555 TaxID=3154889 RepID=UPI0033A46DEF
MRVAHVHWAALPTMGGIETHLESLTTDTEFFAGTRDARTAVFHPCLEPGGGGSAADLADLTRRLAGADVVHLHNPQWHRPEVTDHLVRHLPVPRVLDVHNLAVRGTDTEALRRWSALGGHLVAHSEFVAAELRAEVPSATVTVLPLALPRAVDGPPPIADNGRPVVLQPTRLSSWKGSDLSLTMAADLLDRGHDFDFVHAGSEQLLWDPNIDEALLRRVEPWRERGRIRFVHYQPDRSWAAIGAADLVVHPTAGTQARGEPYSMSVAQAVITGRPLVVSRSGNLPALVDGYPAARTVDVGDATALRDAVESFLRGDWPRPGRAAMTRSADALRAYHDSAPRRHREFAASLADDRAEAAR